MDISGAMTAAEMRQDIAPPAIRSWAGGREDVRLIQAGTVPERGPTASMTSGGDTVRGWRTAPIPPPSSSNARGRTRADKRARTVLGAVPRSGVPDRSRLSEDAPRTFPVSGRSVISPPLRGNMLRSCERPGGTCEPPLNSVNSVPLNGINDTIVCRRGQSRTELRRDVASDYCRNSFIWPIECPSGMG